MKKEENVIGTVFDIQRFSIHDGPGIRTTVFLKGCPLHCAWCHNPEGISEKPNLLYSAEKCISCGKCESICPQKAHHFDENGHTVDFACCTNCFLCAVSCPSEALRKAGKTMTAIEVVEEALRDEPFFKTSGGGLTLSGGEPLMQGDFATAVAACAKKRGIHVCLETSGFASKEAVEKILPFVDVFLFDYKISDEKKHKEYIGVSREKILENLALLSKNKKEIVLRCPIIPDVNDNKEHYSAIAALAEKFDAIGSIWLEPYHPYGLKKYEAMGIEATYNRKNGMEEEKIEFAKEFIKSKTKKKVI